MKEIENNFTIVCLCYEMRYFYIKSSQKIVEGCILKRNIENRVIFICFLEVLFIILVKSCLKIFEDFEKAKNEINLK